VEHRFGPFRLQYRRPPLWRDGRETILPPKALDLLYLAEHAGTVLSRNQLLEALSKTEMEGSVVSRLARMHPAELAPTTM
jgi:DNA-binding winged helix-turn-helix (wHTH) protein